MMSHRFHDFSTRGSGATEQNPKCSPDFLLFSRFFFEDFLFDGKFQFEKINIWAKFENLDVPLAQNSKKKLIFWNSFRKMKIQIRTKKKLWRSVEIIKWPVVMTHNLWVIWNESLNFWKLRSADSGGSDKVFD